MRSPRSSLSVLCGTAPCLSPVCFRVAPIRPISASRRLALQRLCVASGFVFSGWFSVLDVAPVFSRLVSCSLRVFFVDHGEQSFKWNVMCLCVLCYTFLVCGMRWVWHLEKVHRCSPLNPTMGCPVQFLLFECLRLFVNECLLLLFASHAHSVSFDYPCFGDSRPLSLCGL